MSLSNNIVVPERMQLETVFGCNANCFMCPVNAPSKRKKGIMSIDLFKKITDEMAPFRERIKKFDLWGLGEPLLDKTLYEKIKYTKLKGFQNLAIATNADLLTKKCQDYLLDSGLDTIIFSIDGYKKETHESIRRGVDFDRVIKNVQSIIEKRNKDNYKTRFVVRFIRQKCNKSEWKMFKEYWLTKISLDRKDIIICYNAHTWAGEMPFFEDIIEKRNSEIEEKPCHHIYDRLVVLWDGTVALCCSDLHNGEYALGNVNDSSPINIFNNEKIKKIREIHQAGKKNNMRICRECSILYSEAAQEVVE